MSVKLAKTYTALREAGAPDEMAREAVEEIATYERRLMRVEIRMNVLLAGTGALVRDAVGEPVLHRCHLGERGAGVGAEEADLSRPEGVEGSTRITDRDTPPARPEVPHRSSPTSSDSQRSSLLVQDSPDVFNHDSSGYLASYIQPCVKMVCAIIEASVVPAKRRECQLDSSQ